MHDVPHWHQRVVHDERNSGPAEKLTCQKSGGLSAALPSPPGVSAGHRRFARISPKGGVRRSRLLPGESSGAGIGSGLQKEPLPRIPAQGRRGRTGFKNATEWAPRPGTGNKPLFFFAFQDNGARGEIRTRTPVRAEDFESPASTVPPLGPDPGLSAARRRGQRGNRCRARSAPLTYPGGWGTEWATR